MLLSTNFYSVYLLLSSFFLNLFNVINFGCFFSQLQESSFPPAALFPENRACSGGETKWLKIKRIPWAENNEKMALVEFKADTCVICKTFLCFHLFLLLENDRFLESGKWDPSFQNISVFPPFFPFLDKDHFLESGKWDPSVGTKCRTQEAGHTQ